MKTWSNFPKTDFYSFGKIGNFVVIFHHTFSLGWEKSCGAPEFVRLHFAFEAPNSPREAHHGL